MLVSIWFVFAPHEHCPLHSTTGPFHSSSLLTSSACEHSVKYSISKWPRAKEQTYTRLRNAVPLVWSSLIQIS